ncbi:MAG: ATP-grasp domain-containing protein [Luminiphilus sp.]|nr:ATP-grasp domain-containing protein [Luminiphilus sp.]
MPTALLTLGRLPKALAIARALRTQGYRVIVAEPFAWHVSRVSKDVAKTFQLPAPNDDAGAYQQALLELITEEQVDLVVPISEEAHYVLAIRNHLPPHVTLFGPDVELYRTLADKAAFINSALQKALTAPRSAPADSPLAATISETVDYITKPINGCSGIDVAFHRAGDLLTTKSSKLLVQQAIEGDVVSSLSMIKAGEIQATTVYQGSVYAGTVAICFERLAEDMAEKVRQWVQNFMRDLNYSGFIAFDFIVDASGIPQAIECNPRLTSGIHFFTAESLGAALATPQKAALTLHKNAAWQWRYSTLTEAYAALFSGDVKEFWRRMKLCWRVSDVVWSWRDPLPFLLMTPLSWPILKPALLEGISLGEACQRDIAPLWSETSTEAVTGVGNEV